MRGLWRDFQAFALRANLLELAVAFVLGVAFAAVVQSLVDDVLMNLIAAVFGEPDFSNLTFALGDAEIRYGRFLTALVTFLIVAFVLFLLVRLIERVMRPRVDERDCPYCLTTIPTAARVCAACTREVV